MTNKYSITSNEVKLFKHLDNLKHIQLKQARPVMFHISPTNICNMVCSHCCFSGRDKTIELDPVKLLEYLHDIRMLGVKAIEWTGGGEPTMYKALGDITKIAKDMGFSIGMNTNGIKYKEDLDYSLFDWVRVSLNVFDMNIDFREWKSNVKRIQEQTKVTACYIAGNEFKLETLYKIFDFAEEYKIYTRLAPDCIQDKEGIKALISDLKDIVDDIKPPFIMLSDFNIFLEERKENNCLIHMLKPFLFTDGYVYACPSSELAVENGKTVQKEFRICKAEDIFDYYMNNFEVKKFNCSYCKYTNQNNILTDVITEVEDERFC